MTEREVSGSELEASCLTLLDEDRRGDSGESGDAAGEAVADVETSEVAAARAEPAPCVHGRVGVIAASASDTHESRAGL